jgi:protein-tyrosine phosphatase
VLGLGRAHRRAAVELDPSANRRAFTLTEFTTVLGALDPGELAITGSGNDIRQHLALVVSAAARSRGVVATSRDIAYDIEDPYRREPEAYRRSARAIEETVSAMVARLAALVRTSGGSPQCLSPEVPGT